MATSSAAPAPSASSGTPAPSGTPDGERGDLLRILSDQRRLLRIAVRGVTDEDARRRTTVSGLTLGGILRHVTACERSWVGLMTRGDGVMPEGMLDGDQHRMRDDETVAGLLDDYAAAARETEEAVAALESLDRQCLLPRFPWGPQEDVHWSARFVLLHVLRETAHHCGHADIVREALDGSSTTAQMAGDPAA
ncbi:DinB family protein [Streptomyces sp. NPDC001380]|uniref:DinB family protein n=1 Tax=Streptomyces sp. NPDC001380 TaxID=3364566 RepID=UPI0036A3BCBB